MSFSIRGMAAFNDGALTVGGYWGTDYNVRFIERNNVHQYTARTWTTTNRAHGRPVMIAASEQSMKVVVLTNTPTLLSYNTGATLVGNKGHDGLRGIGFHGERLFGVKRGTLMWFDDLLNVDGVIASVGRNGGWWMAKMGDGFVISKRTSVEAFDAGGNQLWQMPCSSTCRDVDIDIRGRVNVAVGNGSVITIEGGREIYEVATPAGRRLGGLAITKDGRMLVGTWGNPRTVYVYN